MEKQGKKLLIMRAAPGSGKSTWIKNNILTMGCEVAVCSADDFFVMHGRGEYLFDPKLLFAAHNQCFRRARKAMEREVPVVVIDNTNIKKRDYVRYIECAKENGYEVFQKVLNGNYGNVHGVPEDKVQSMRAALQLDEELAHWKEE